MSDLPEDPIQPLAQPHNRSPQSNDTSQTSVQSIFDTTLHNYSHRPNIIPPYVLDALSQVHYKEQLDNSNVNYDVNSNVHRPSHRSSSISHGSHATNVVNPEEFTSFQNDAFIKSMNGNWHTFLSSIKQPSSMSDPFTDPQFNGDKLNGPWEGEQRLKVALLGDEEDEGSTEPSRFWLKAKAKENTAVIRSKAGYWMSTDKRAVMIPALKRIFLQNPLIPLFLRIIMILFSTIALALAISIFVFSRRHYDGASLEQQPSTIMAVVVQCCAIAYLAYISYDEYAGKPLGLRDPWGKIRLIMLDMLFIIFSSANLSLAFNTEFDDEWVCRANPNTGDLSKVGVFYPTVASICRRQRALAGFLFLVLVLWVVTFLVSLLRVVHRVSGKTS